MYYLQMTYANENSEICTVPCISISPLEPIHIFLAIQPGTDMESIGILYHDLAHNP